MLITPIDLAGEGVQVSVNTVDQLGLIKEIMGMVNCANDPSNYPKKLVNSNFEALVDCVDTQSLDDEKSEHTSVDVDDSNEQSDHNIRDNDLDTTNDQRGDNSTMSKSATSNKIVSTEIMN